MRQLDSTESNKPPTEKTAKSIQIGLQSWIVRPKATDVSLRTVGCAEIICFNDNVFIHTY